MLKKTTLLIAIALSGLLALLIFQSDPSTEHTSNSDPAPNSSTLPSFSYRDILENDEFKTGMQQAVHNSDIEKAKALQQRALEIAYAANLPETEISLLSGDRGLSYMQFLAKRQLFSQAFERRYKALGGIQDIKLIYPEAKDLFKQSDSLIAKRDAAINDIAKELANGQDTTPFIELAEQQWLLLNQ